MIVRISPLLSPEALTRIREALREAQWIDGRTTAGFQSAGVKHNLQLNQADSVARAAGELVLQALERNSLFLSAALPHHLYPPLFNRYEPGMAFGMHVDNALR